jgi:outer membrane protein OmpA-like peptidoglycan-associated protein
MQYYSMPFVPNLVRFACAVTLVTLGLLNVSRAQDAPQKPEIKALGVEANGVERSVIEIRVDEYLSRKIHPLLNYVFFDDNSAEIPSRYHKMSDVQAETFSLNRLYGLETIEVYYDVLNIIGLRLKNNPALTLTLVGCNSNVGVEKGNKDLSERRAKAIQTYFTDVWKIDAARLPIQSRDLPEKASTSKDGPSESDAENRRVELLGSWDVIQPVMITDTLREATPPTIRFYTKVYQEETPEQWSIIALQRGKKLRDITAPGKVRPVVDWKINKEKNALPIDTVPMTYRLEVRYKGDIPNQKSNQGSMPVQQVTLQKKRRERINDIEKDKYSLILFDFGSDKLGEANQKIVDIIKADKRITPKSKVVVTGYTDNLGNPDFNQKLSQRRAESAAAGLGVSKSSVKEVLVQGKGKTPPLLYEVEYPEGRFYCRTVVIDVENPVEYDN